MAQVEASENVVYDSQDEKDEWPESQALLPGNKSTEDRQEPKRLVKPQVVLKIYKRKKVMRYMDIRDLPLEICSRNHKYWIDFTVQFPISIRSFNPTINRRASAENSQP